MGNDDIARHVLRVVLLKAARIWKFLVCTKGHEGAQCFISYCLIFLTTFLYEINIQMYN